MFGFIKKMFSGNSKQTIEDARNTIQETSAYNKELIGTFKDTHRELFDKYAEIKTTFEETPDEWHKIKDLLEEFKIGLEIHILVEDNQLYTYLKTKYGKDPRHAGYIDDIQRSMDNIAKEVMRFAKKYSNWENYKRNKEFFIKDLEDIGDALTKRINMEERNLYPMYSE